MPLPAGRPLPPAHVAPAGTPLPAVRQLVLAHISPADKNLATAMVHLAASGQPHAKTTRPFAAPAAGAALAALFDEADYLPREAGGPPDTHAAVAMRLRHALKCGMADELLVQLVPLCAHMQRAARTQHAVGALRGVEECAGAAVRVAFEGFEMTSAAAAGPELAVRYPLRAGRLAPYTKWLRRAPAGPAPAPPPATVVELVLADPAGAAVDRLQMAGATLFAVQNFARRAQHMRAAAPGGAAYRVRAACVCETAFRHGFAATPYARVLALYDDLRAVFAGTKAARSERARYGKDYDALHAPAFSREAFCHSKAAHMTWATCLTRVPAAAADPARLAWQFEHEYADDSYQPTLGAAADMTFVGCQLPPDADLCLKHAALNMAWPFAQDRDDGNHQAHDRFDRGGAATEACATVTRRFTAMGRKGRLETLRHTRPEKYALGLLSAPALELEYWTACWGVQIGTEAARAPLRYARSSAPDWDQSLPPAGAGPFDLALPQQRGGAGEAAAAAGTFARYVRSPATYPAGADLPARHGRVWAAVRRAAALLAALAPPSFAHAKLMMLQDFCGGVAASDAEARIAAWADQASPDGAWAAGLRAGARDLTPDGMYGAWAAACERAFERHRRRLQLARSLCLCHSLARTTGHAPFVGTDEAPGYVAFRAQPAADPAAPPPDTAGLDDPEAATPGPAGPPRSAFAAFDAERLAAAGRHAGAGAPLRSFAEAARLLAQTLRDLRAALHCRGWTVGAHDVAAALDRPAACLFASMAHPSVDIFAKSMRKCSTVTAADNYVWPLVKRGPDGFDLATMAQKGAPAAERRPALRADARQGRAPGRCVGLGATAQHATRPAPPDPTVGAGSPLGDALAARQWRERFDAEAMHQHARRASERDAPNALANLCVLRLRRVAGRAHRLPTLRLDAEPAPEAPPAPPALLARAVRRAAELLARAAAPARPGDRAAEAAAAQTAARELGLPPHAAAAVLAHLAPPLALAPGPAPAAPPAARPQAKRAADPLPRPGAKRRAPPVAVGVLRTPAPPKAAPPPPPPPGPPPGPDPEAARAARTFAQLAEALRALDDTLRAEAAGAATPAQQRFNDWMRRVDLGALWDCTARGRELAPPGTHDADAHWREWHARCAAVPTADPGLPFAAWLAQAAPRLSAGGPA
jgi:hypothetical protein